ncbi:MAG: ABC transporter substrate binding protein [Candidatus Binatia bacterium]
MFKETTGHVSARLSNEYMLIRGRGLKETGLLFTKPSDVIVARGTQATLAAKKATSTIPIVMTRNSDPVGTGLVATLARPGANIAGMRILAPRTSLRNGLNCSAAFYGELRVSAFYGIRRIRVMSMNWRQPRQRQER